MADSHDFGKKAELAARDYLKNLGYQIVESNWHYGHLEVDMIAKVENQLVIVEVKARQTDDFGHPSEFISQRKEKNLIEAADHYVVSRGLDVEVRFDVITVLGNENDLKIEHFPEAFTAF